MIPDKEANGYFFVGLTSPYQWKGLTSTSMIREAILHQIGVFFTYDDSERGYFVSSF